MTIQEQAKALAARAESEGLNFIIDITRPRQADQPWYAGQVFSANRQVFPIGNGPTGPQA